MDTIAGKYQIVGELGVGSTGTVYLVEHLDLGVRYALKILNPILSNDDHFIERFKREASILSRFSHAGTVQLRDFGRTAEGRYYMATDFCQGVGLKEILEREGPLEIERTLDIVEATLSVLDAAHELGIVHRDIKPDNIMIFNDPESGEERIRVLDFGIAKLKEGLQLKGTSTLEGTSVGTPQYMSPEQASGELDVDHRTDLYSLGVLMYELLSGKTPFEGETVVKTLLMHLTRPVEPFSVAAPESDIPGFLEEVVLRALAKERERRFQTAAEFLEACQVVRELLPSYRAGVREDASTDHPALEPDVSDETAEVETEKEQERIRILCLDDQEMILNILDHVLTAQGFQVYTAINFTTIHQYIFQEHVDLMLCDVAMPGLSGPQVCKLLKSTVKDLTIILFSNMPERELERVAVECKADGWISKHSKPNEWIERIREVLEVNAPASDLE